MTNRHLYMLFAAILTLAFTAGSASAGSTTGDPRRCDPHATPQATPDKPADCAKAAAKITLLTYMRANRGRYWSNPISCNQAAAPSLLRWRCSFGTGSATVQFRATSSGWKRAVTVTMNP